MAEQAKIMPTRLVSWNSHLTDPLVNYLGFFRNSRLYYLVLKLQTGFSKLSGYTSSRTLSSAMYY